VDDDEALRCSLATVVAKAGWTARPCDSGAELLRRVDGAQPACIVLDLSMPGMSGVELQRELIERGIDLPIIFVTGTGTVSIAVAALRAGAFDFMEKPVAPELLVERIDAALLAHPRRIELATIRELIGLLTPRELEICELFSTGLAAKQIAQRLGLSPRTIEHHREHALKKTGTTNSAELMRLYVRARGDDDELDARNERQRILRTRRAPGREDVA